jgi:ADP-L-glycero-D-manno-heptose 6-epimerase
MTRRIIFVTGGAGFIGSNIVARLSEDPTLDLVVCDRLGDVQLGKWRNLVKHPIGDFVEPEDMWEWLEKRWREVEVVIHMGAVSSTTDGDADRVMTTNFGLSRDLYRWCTDHQRRFIYASSAASYGDGALGFDDVQTWQALSALRPLNVYGWSKALFDVFATRQAARGYAPPQWVGLKFFNVYGPNEEHKGVMRSIASQIWPDVAGFRTVKLFRSYHPDYPHGGQLRDFVYVNGVFTLGCGRARSFNDVANAVFAAAGREPSIEYIEMPKALRPRYQYFTEAKMDRLRAAGYAAEPTSLEDGVGDYVRGYLGPGEPYR